MGIEGRFAYGSFRPGQRELAQRVYEACLHGETLIAEATSGFGKTAAVIAGALTAAEETHCKIVYACRTKRQISRVVEEVAKLQGRHSFRAVSLLSKFDYCLLRRQRSVPSESFGWYCTFNVSNNLCSYFLNVSLTEGFNHLVRDVLAKTPHHSDLMRLAEINHVCPYEVARLAVAQADMVVAPYHYAFDPKAASVLFDRNSVERKDTILVVDEAHNLRDFFRGMNSATLTLAQVEGAVREAQAMLMDDAAESLRTLLRTLEALQTERQGWILDRAAVLDRIRQDHGAVWLQNLAFELSASSGAAWGSVMYERRLPSLILRVGEFLVRLSSPKPILVKWENSLGLVDPDPVKDVAEYLAEFRSSTLLSATINPSELFARSLGLGRQNVRMYDASTEPSIIVKTAVDTGTSTRYSLRTSEMYSKISERVATVIRATDSGVGVFVPSYSVLQPVLEMVTRRITDRNIVSEAHGLSNEQAEEVFNSFRSRDDSVLFAVQGGRFSEGEDFEGGAMGAVVVIGMALPPPSPMMYAEYSCLKRMGEPDSYLMLSRLPALRKAFQAAGRHVRGPGKRGLVFFLDERFGSSAARELMPSWLRRDLTVCDLTPDRIVSFSHEFWSSLG
ncbi:MAG TPA: ATP-dependent DNA helicase [Nitrososphaerales archaeon]|nr:ATP-dependent DNA helicase [Nitrososphaerales archaeon]